MISPLTKYRRKNKRLTDNGARRCGHLSSKATHWLFDLLNQSTRSRPRSWNGVGKPGSKSSIKETGYQWSLHVNLEAELSSPSSSSALNSSSWNWSPCVSVNLLSGSEVGGGDVGGAATLSGKGGNFNLLGAWCEKRLVGLMGKRGGNLRELFLAADDDRATTDEEAAERGWSSDMLWDLLIISCVWTVRCRNCELRTDDFFILTTGRDMWRVV